MTSFTAHNIRFTDGSLSIPDHPHVLADVPHCEGAKRVLSMLYGDACEGKRIADLGCLEGGYALEFARMGLDSFGIEVRTSSFENCQEVKRRAELPNLDFAQDDVWNIAKYGPFDVIFCCGLLYHLDRPRAFIQLMGQQAQDAIIINTHYAPQGWRPKSVFKFSSMTEHEGLPGRWYEEPKTETDEQREKFKWASWDNHRSFWPTKEALLHAMNEAGFDLAFEQFDTFGNILHNGTSKETKLNHRGVFVGIRTRALAGRSAHGHE